MSIDELAAAAKDLVDRGATPAIQIAVGRDNEVILFETFGTATNDNRFCVFSATKPIVASSMWLLIGDGRLDVSRPVAHYIPEFATNGKEGITVEQLMLHTAGFPNAPMDPIEGADTVTRVKRFTEWELEWEPGTRFEYHGLSAHWVLVELLERFGGEDFRDALEHQVCEPLGLPLLLGIPEEQQGDIALGVPVGEPPATNPVDVNPVSLLTPAAIAAGVPGGGGIMTAATMVRFYQAMLHNPTNLWDDAVLADAKTNIRCTFPDPLMNVACNRTLGLVLAGDDGMHQFRYAMFGKDNSPGSFGHAGAFSQVAWADPATGISFALVKNGLQMDLMADAVSVMPITDIASSLT